MTRVFYAVASVIALLIVLPHAARAGGPHNVAGTSYFDSTSKGVPLTWAGARSATTPTGET